MADSLKILCVQGEGSVKKGLGDIIQSYFGGDVEVAYVTPGAENFALGLEHYDVAVVDPDECEAVHVQQFIRRCSLSNTLIILSSFFETINLEKKSEE